MSPTAAAAAVAVAVDVTGDLQPADGGCDSLVFRWCHAGVASRQPAARACGAGHAFVDSTAHVVSAATNPAVMRELPPMETTSSDGKPLIMLYKETGALQQQQQQQHSAEAQCAQAHQQVLKMVEQAAHASRHLYGISYD